MDKNPENPSATAETPTLAPGCAITSFPRNAALMSPEMRALERQTFEIAFESALNEIAMGSTLADFCREYHVALQPGRFRAWIYANASRKRAHEAAQALWADAVADEMMRISDGFNPDGSAAPGDVQRSQLMIATRKWLMAARNRAKYGDVKKVEQTTTTTIDVTTMSVDDLKRYVVEQLGEAGIGDSDSMGFLEGELGGDGDE